MNAESAFARATEPVKGTRGCTTNSAPVRRRTPQQRCGPTNEHFDQ